jgi:hypothetical protein
MIHPLPDSLPTKNYDAIKAKMQRVYSCNTSLWQTFWTEASINNRLEAGDTSYNYNSNRNQYYVNFTRPLLNMVSGHQRRNRKSSICVPLESGDQQTADQWTKILLHIFKRENVYHTISDAFHSGACVSGMSLMHLYLDFRNDPINGDLKIDHLAYNQFYIDPYYRKKDLSDAAFVWRRTFMSHAQAASLLPEKDFESIMHQSGNPMGGSRDAKFQYMPEAAGVTYQNLIAYDEFYYRDFRTQKLLIDRTSGEQLDVSDKENIDIESFIEDNPEIYYMEQDIPTCRLAIAIQDQIYYDGMNPLGIDELPFVPVTGYYNSAMPYFYSRCQSIATSLRDPQILLNNRIMLNEDMAQSVVTSGFIFKEGSIVDIKNLFQTGAGRMIPVKKGTNIAEDVVPIPPPQVPPSYFQLQETMEQSMFKVTGITEELMGASLDAKAGITEILRQSAGLTTLQPLFDNLDDSQVILSNKIMSIVRANYAPYKVRQILEGEEPAPMFFDKAFGRYHCMVQEGFNTQSQIQMEFAQKLQLRELGIMITDEDMIESATLQHKDRLIANMQRQKQEMMQQQQAMQQSQMQEAEARSMLAKERAFADHALGIERLSQADTDRATALQELAKANKQDEEAILNKVKILKEIEDMDIGHLERLVGIANLLRVDEQQQKTKSEKI